MAIIVLILYFAQEKLISVEGDKFNFPKRGGGIYKHWLNSS